MTENNESELLSIPHLFETETKALIAWNLLVFKELTAKILVNLTRKNMSTITRNLNDMKKKELVEISRTERVSYGAQIFQVNHWRINPRILIGSLSSVDKIIKEFLVKGQPSPESQELGPKIIKTIEGIIHSVVKYRIENILATNEKQMDHQKEEQECEVISFFLLDEKTGKLFNTQLQEFLSTFVETHSPTQVPLENIDQDSYVCFLLGSRIRNAVSPVK
ncbi:MAG: hypothetical protein ACXAEU_01655 [Candidatus Hodarchaeales archaeon]